MRFVAVTYLQWISVAQTIQTLAIPDEFCENCARKYGVIYE